MLVLNLFFVLLEVLLAGPLILIKSWRSFFKIGILFFS